MTITQKFINSIKGNRGERSELIAIEYLNYKKPAGSKQNSKGSKLADLIDLAGRTYQMKGHKATLPTTYTKNKINDFETFLKDDASEFLLLVGWWSKRWVLFTIPKSNALEMAQADPTMLWYCTTRKTLRLNVNVKREPIFTNFAINKVELRFE